MSFRASRRPGRALAVAAALSLWLAGAAGAGPRDQARRIHDRLVGVPPDTATLDQMTALIVSGGVPSGALAAAEQAMQHPAFYRTALKNFITPWTNVERTVFADLNDYTATVIGIIRDERPFTEVLTADLVYVGAPGVVGVGYSQSDNEHYRLLEENLVDLGDPALLVPSAQSALPGALISPGDAAQRLCAKGAISAALRYARR